MHHRQLKYFCLKAVVILFLIITPSDLISMTVAQPDTSLYYFADRIEYIASENTVYLTKNSRLRYKDTFLSAYRIIFDMNTNTVSAFQREDTLFSAIDPSIIDTIAVSGMPALTERGETVTGRNMTYHLDTKQGSVSGASTVIRSARDDDDTFFSTENMVLLENNCIHGLNARITNCDLDHPHWHFKADSIIVTNNDWVFAKPVTLYFDEVPVGWFPFFLYKNSRGRNSGFILPSYYYSNTRGNSFRNFGFFWDMSDYTDYTVLADFYDNYGYFIRQNFRYRKRHVIDGYISADFANDYKSRDWRIRGSHDHNISPSMTFNANADYVTKRSLVRDMGETSADRMQNKLFTSGVFNKRWFNTGDNLRIMSSSTQYVDTAIVRHAFPNVSYRMGGRRPFSDTDLPLVFRRFQYDGSLNGVRNLNVYEEKNIFDENTNASLNLSQRTDISSVRVGSSQNFIFRDHKSKFYISSRDDDIFEQSRRDSSLTNYGLKTSYYVQNSHTIFRHINLRETFNFRHDTAFRYFDDGLNIVTGSKGRSTFDLNATADTKIYGIFQPEFYALRRMRHTISPSVGFTYYPDFSKDKYGYFVTDSLGVRRDVFSPSVIGGTPSGENMRLNYSLMNVFEAKVMVSERERLIRLFNLNFSGFYNFAADSNKMSVINSRLHSNLYNGQLIGNYVRMNLTLNANAVFTPYTMDGGQGEYINRDFTFWEKNPFRRERWDLTYTAEFPFSLRGALSADDRFRDDPVEYDESGLVIIRKSDYADIPFDINGRILFSERYDSNDNYTKNFHGSIGARVSPTENWTVEYRATYNMLMPDRLTSTVISVRRDMHCWYGEFEWDYFNRGFKLIIQNTSNIFSDLKYDKDTRERRW